jgi:hypothetical protein
VAPFGWSGRSRHRLVTAKPSGPFTSLKTVMSTNPVESMIEIVRAHARNVKRWQDGDMRLRCAAAGMHRRRTVRRVKGYRQLPQLAAALRHAIGANNTSTVAVTA